MQRAGFSFLICPDAEIVRERVERLLADSGQSFVREVFWGDEELGAPFWSALAVGSLFAGRRAVVLRRAEALPVEFWPKLASALRALTTRSGRFLPGRPPGPRGRPKLPKTLESQPYFRWPSSANGSLSHPG